MSVHAKRNFRPRARVLGAVTGIALVLGGGFAAQAFADAPAAPQVTSTGDATPQVTSPSAAAQPAGAPQVTSGSSQSAPAQPTVGSAPAGSASAGNAPQVIQPGSAVNN